MTPMMAGEPDSDSVILTMGITEAADIRKSDSQFTDEYINSVDYVEFGHGDDQTPAPVRVESWQTVLFGKSYTGVGYWYLHGSGEYAFGWEYDDTTKEWYFNEFHPEDIENGVYDTGGANETLRDSYGNYLFIGNHTRFHIATNYRPFVTFTAPEYLYNGTSQIKVKQMQIGWNTSKYAVIPGGGSKKLTNNQCSPGPYTTNQFAVFAVIEMPEEWWTLESGEYLGTAVLTLSSE